MSYTAVYIGSVLEYQFDVDLHTLSVDAMSDAQVSLYAADANTEGK